MQELKKTPGEACLLTKQGSINRSWARLVFLIAAGFFLGERDLFAQSIKDKIESVQAIPGWNRILVSWEKNEYLSETESLVLVRKKDSCPQNILDGEELYRGNGTFFEDRTAVKKEAYCYGVGILSLAGDSTDFKASQPAKSLSLGESALNKLGNKLNLVIFLETIVLIGLLSFNKIKQKKTKTNAESSVCQ